MERGELRAKFDDMLHNPTIPERARQAMMTAVVVYHDDEGETAAMIRRTWDSQQLAEGLFIHVMPDGRVMLERIDGGVRTSFQPLAHDTLGHWLAHAEWLPLGEI